jgi:hypothetical protein
MVKLAALLLATSSVMQTHDGARYPRRWFYSMTNLQVAENADRLIQLIGRASKAGYNGVVLADYKLNLLDRVPEHYFTNLKRVRRAADAAGVEIIPTVFPIGYSNGLLAHDPNLAEGMPVEKASFLVQGREAVLAPSVRSRLANGDLEETNGDTFRRFGYQDAPGAATFADRKVAHHGLVSCRIESGGGAVGVRRLIHKAAVRPHGCYRLSAWVKTEGLSNTGDFRLLAIGATTPARTLTFHEGGIEPTQDWRLVEVVLNSLDNTEVNVYAGLWGTGKGRLWVDELSLDALSLVNVLRRSGCPLNVTSDDGRTVYQEGRDFDPVADPKLGNVPYAGEFEFSHEPARLRLATGSRIRDGQTLRVSWYHPVLTHGSQIMCCPSEPKTYDLLRDQARRVNELLRPKTFFMSHDEIRVMNWCKACTDRKLSPGQILADNVSRCRAILKQVNPKAEVVVWSDMFDPSHNAGKSYYLVNGTLDGSWEGLDPEVVIANWNGGKARASLEFFAGKKHRQVIAGYYDADDLSGFTRWDDAARGVPGVVGFMYTTWQAKFGLLESYGRAAMSAR